MCVRHGRGASSERTCTVLASGEASLPIAGACPEWAYPNASGSGYFRSAMTSADIDRALSADGLSVAERVALLGDLQALVASGDAPAKDALAVAERMAGDRNRQVVRATLGVGESVGGIVTDALRPRYAAMVRRLFGERARALGWSPRPGEDEDTRLLRRTLLFAVGTTGEDRALCAEARSLAEKWLSDEKALDPNLVDIVLPLAARYADAAFFTRLRAEAMKTSDRKRRDQLIEALGSFHDPEVAKQALRLPLEEGLDPRDTIGVVFRASFDPATHTLGYTFVKDNFDALAKRLPRDTGAYLPYVGQSACSAAGRADLVSFFKTRAADFPGGPRIFDQVVEQVDQCTALARAQASSLASFLER